MIFGRPLALMNVIAIGENGYKKPITSSAIYNNLLFRSLVKEQNTIKAIKKREISPRKVIADHKNKRSEHAMVNLNLRIFYITLALTGEKPIKFNKDKQ